MLLVVAVLAGCATDSPPDTTADKTGGCLEGVPETFCAPLGSSCVASESPFCERGLAWCSSGVCRSFCDAISYPHCATSETEQWSHTLDGGSVCVCLPAQ